MGIDPVLIAAADECNAICDQLVYRTRDVIRRDTGDVEGVRIAALVDQLRDAAYPSNELKSGGGGGGKPGSRPPANLDALDLYDTIARTCRTKSRRVADTLGDLVTAATGAVILGALRCDAPGCDNLAAIQAWTRTLRGWRDRIKQISGADPVRLRSMPIPCPACGQRWVIDLADGDQGGVRTDAVFVEFHGDAVQAFGCHACGDVWRGVDLDALVDWQLGRPAAA